MFSTTLPKFENDLMDTVRLFPPVDDVAHTSRDEDALWRDEFSVTVQGQTFSRAFETTGHWSDDLQYIRLRKRFCKQGLYETLRQATGYRPPWGALTGIRPTRLVYEGLAEGLSVPQAVERVRESFDVSPEKAALLQQIIGQQTSIYDRTSTGVSVYVGIPFCPTRCSYCSFASTDLRSGGKWTGAYVDALLREIAAGARDMRALGRTVRSVYVGGGTPTALSARELGRVLQGVLDGFGSVPEFTVEAGRPDSIDREKLGVIREAGATRISVNPQSMNDKTLQAIGRSHSAAQIPQAFDLARQMGFDNINMDIIAALPGETVSDFDRTLARIVEMRPESVTVHTLAIKRASALKLGGYRQVDGQTAQEMVERARALCMENGYAPYYLYRQKYMAGNLENVGYCLPGKACVYNVDVMEETTCNLAFGAGAITKWVSDDRRRIERAANLKNIELYIARVDEMIQKKRALYGAGEALE